MDDDLICNYGRKCRKPLGLETFAWVTSCSHIFCDADGKREFANSLVCPACDTSLPNTYDIIRIELRPSEQRKAIMLCGLRPEIALEMCIRAVAFWNYQCHQERTYQLHIASKARDKNVQLEHYYEDVISRLRSELNSVRKDIGSMKTQLEQYKTKCRDLNVKLTEKTSQHTKLQALYDALRRRCVTPATFNHSRDTADTIDNHARNFMMNISSRDDVLGPPGANGRGYPRPPIRRSPPERDFSLRQCPPGEFTMTPNHVPLVGDASNLPFSDRGEC